MTPKEPIFAENASLFFFILNNQVTRNFGWRAFWIIFTTGKLLVLVLTVFFAKGGNTVYNSYQSRMFWFLLQRNPVRCMNTPKNKLKDVFLVGLALKEGDYFAG